MLPSRGSRSAHHIPLALRQFQPLSPRIIVSRKFSSVPRASTISPPSRRSISSPLLPQSAKWRNGAIAGHNANFNITAVRHGSWYAPWTWGNSGTGVMDANGAASSTSQAAGVLQSTQTQPPTVDPVVTTATPELSPAGIDKPAIVEGAPPSQPSSDTVEHILDEYASNLPIDPTAAIEKFGALKELGLDYGWGFTAFYEWLLEHVYVWGGYGWSGSIIIAAIIIRMGTFPLQVRASHSMAKIAAVQPVLKPMSREMIEAMRKGDQAKANLLKKRQSQVYKELNITPIKGMWPMLAQGAFGFGAFRCLRGMSNLPAPGFEQGGWAWFQNLAVSDPYYVLPALSGGIMWYLLKSGGETGAANQTMEPGTKFAMQIFLPVLITAITVWQPAGIQLYMVSATLLGATSATILKNKGFRKRMNLTPLPTAESNEFWTKVAEGQIPLEKAQAIIARSKATGKPAYLPPTITTTASTSSPMKKRTMNTITNRGLTIKASSTLPPHLRPAQVSIDKKNPDRDADYDSGPPEGFFKKMNWAARNFRPRYVWNSVKTKSLSILGREDLTTAVLQQRKDMAKRKAQEYEERRKERLKR